LKTYCIDSKEITTDDVNLCVGFSRDFNEFDFLQAVLTKNYNEAIRIYNRLTLKEDVEIYLVSLLSSSMISISKLFDAKASDMNEFALKREFKLWWKDSDKRLRILKEYKSKINELKLKQAFDYIYQADKSLKSISSENRKTILTNLIYALTNL
jgi:DNA polymerase III delta subunit